MANQQLFDYIKQQLQQGISREIITNNLISRGWPQSDVSEAFLQLSGQNFLTQEGQGYAAGGDANKNGKATTGMVLGIIGLLAWVIPLFGAPITIIGLVFGIKGLKSLKRGVAIAAIVLSSIGLFATIVNASIGAYQAAMGQNYIVNKLSDKNNQNLQIGTAQATPLTNNNTGSKTEFINKAVQELKAQLSFPYKADEVTTLTNVTVEPNAIRYHFLLSVVDTSNLSNDILRNNIIQDICSNQDLVNLLNQDINLEYSYSVENSTQSYFISSTKADCKIT